jgi:hypothetical protein
MRVELDITFRLWGELGLSYIAPSDGQAQAVFLDMGLRWVEYHVDNKNKKKCTYDVIDKDQFFLSVIKYGIEFKEIYV